MDMLILEDIRPAAKLSRRYSVDPRPETLAKFASVFAKSLSSKSPRDMRPLLISSEALAGQIPGRSGFRSYEAAPVLLDKMVGVVSDHFGQDVDLTVWFSTRTPEAWFKSVYYQNVRTTRVTESFEAYLPKLEEVVPLEEVLFVFWAIWTSLKRA